MKGLRGYRNFKKRSSIKCLEPGGYLIIGRKEILPENTMFEPVYPMDGIYRRVD